MKFFSSSVDLSALLPSAVAVPSTYPISAPSALSWDLKPTNTTKQFRGLAPVSKDIVWVSGTDSTVLLTVDGGTTWSNVSPSLSPENSTTFQFRDVAAFSAKSAVVLSIGEGNASRIYQTHDGGRSWKPTFVNTEPTAFYDCLAFENRKHGLAMSDPVDGRFRLIETWDGGATWKIVPPQ